MTAAEYLADQLSKRSMYNSCIDDITEVISEIMEDYTQSRIAELEYKLTSLQVKHGQLEAERDKYREALGVRDSWPVTDVLNKLVEATEYLLDVKNYDRVGWEEVSHCAKLGKQYAVKILEALNSKDKCTHENSVWNSHVTLYCRDCGVTYRDEPLNSKEAG